MKKNIQTKLTLLSSLVFLTIFVLNYENYYGNKAIYIFFNLISFSLFLIVIKIRLTAFEFFFYLFLLMSFWFKYSCIIFFVDIKVIEGDFDILNANYDVATKVIISSFITCIIFSLIRELYNKKKNNKNKLILNSSFVNFYKKNRLIIIITYILFLIFIWLTNFHYSIYSKGIINMNVPNIVKLFFSWLFTYGLSVSTAFVIYIDFIIFKSKKVFLLGIFETLFTHLTIYSRAVFISVIAYFRGYLFLLNDFKIKLNKAILIKTFSLAIVMCVVIFFAISELRNTNFKKINNNEKLKLEDKIFELFHLSVNRWVGIDALLTVSQSNDLNFEILMSSLKEKKEIRKKSFYINNFYKTFEYDETQNKNMNIVITPGIIPFLYYSGSVFFVCISILFLLFICTLIERCFLILSGNNFLLSNIIGYALAVRFIHFGYVPYNTINFLLSFLITLLAIYFFTKLIK